MLHIAMATTLSIHLTGHL